MKEYFVTYDLAVKLKEKGFREHVRGHYKSKFHLSVCSEPMNCNGSISGDISAPQNHEVLEWLRKEKNLHTEIVSTAYGYRYIVSDTPNKGGSDRVNSRYRGSNDGGAWDDYNECVLDAIEYVIDNLI